MHKLHWWPAKKGKPPFRPGALLLSFRKNWGKFNLDKMQLGYEWINNMQPLKVNGTVVELQPYQACIVKLKN